MPGIVAILNNMSVSYTKLNKLDSAYFCASNALKVNQQIQSLPDKAFSFYLIADIFKQAAEINNTFFLNDNFKGNTNKCLAQAKLYADSSVQLYANIKNKENLAKAYKVLSEIQRLLGDYDAALENYINYTIAHDSVYNAEVNKKLTQKTMQYDFDKKEAISKANQEKKNAIAIAEQKRSKQQKIVLVIGLILAIFFGAWDYKQKQRISKQKKRSDELLLNILPAEVAEELKSKGRAEAQLMDEVTVLFTESSEQD